MTWRRILKGLAVLVILILLVATVLPGHSLSMSGYMAGSFNQMTELATAISDYARDHNGNLPKKWSDLRPDDVPYELFLFHSPYSEPVNLKEADLLANPKLIDQYTPYRYMKIADGRILVMEKQGF